MTFLLDSVILIDHFNGIAAATMFLRSIRTDAAVSVITRAEVLAGFGAEEVKPALQLLDSFANLGIDAEIADLAAQLRRTRRWKLPDAFQAALAQHHNLRFATRNTDDFPPRRYRFVEVPYTL